MELRIKNRILNLAKPKVMGVLNVTPDSFSDGGLYNRTDTALRRIEEMEKQGADIIDIGGESTRPGSDPVSADEEINRTVPVIKVAVKKYPELFFSIDTTKYEAAKAALDAGAHVVNDVSGLRHHPEKARLCAEFDAALVIMHSIKKPKTMQDNPVYTDVVSEVKGFLEKQAELAKEMGADKIILDPGIGFGKTTVHNLQLLAYLTKICEVGYPVLVGASRKSMIGSILDNRPVEGRLAGTLAVHYHALMAGAKIIRVHDVEEAADSIKIFNEIQSQIN